MSRSISGIVNNKGISASIEMKVWEKGRLVTKLVANPKFC